MPAPTATITATPTATATEVPWATTVADFNLWEGRIPHMYLDTRGLVTVGVGYLLATVGAAQALGFVRRATGVPGTAADIAADYDRVRQMPKGKLAGSYKPATQLDLPDAAIDALLKTTVARFERGLADNFAGWPSLPVPAKRALMDMAYNLGIEGLLKFKRLKAAVDAGRWAVAAAECRRNGPSDDRNDWTRELFLKAAG